MSLTTEIAKGIGSGLFASVLTAPVDKSLKSLISERQKRREKRVRKASPHEIGGIRFAQRALHRRLHGHEPQEAQLAFTAMYGVIWGSVYYWTRKRYPQIGNYGGLGFALPFFLVCDEIMAPNLKLSPGLQKIPWQFNIKEFANHATWTALAEVAIRAMENKSLVPSLISKFTGDTTKVNSEYSSTSQPSEKDLHQFSRDGYNSLINLRPKEEALQEGALSPEEESEIAERLGLKYVHIPVSSSSPSLTDIRMFIKAYKNLPKPVVGHCKSGQRSGSFYVAYMADRHGWSFDKAMEYAQQMDLEINDTYKSLLNSFCSQEGQEESAQPH